MLSNKNKQSQTIESLWTSSPLKGLVLAICLSASNILSAPVVHAQANNQYMEEYYPQYTHKNLEELRQEYTSQEQEIIQQVNLFDQYGEKAIQSYNEYVWGWNEIGKFETCYRDVCIQDSLKRYLKDVDGSVHRKEVIKFFLVRAISLQINSTGDFYSDHRKLKIILANWRDLQSLL